MKEKFFKRFMGFCLTIVMVVGCALSLTGCGKQETTQERETLVGTEWVATEIYDSNGDLYEPERVYTLRFTNDEQIEVSPDLYIEGYIYNSQAFY